MKKNKKFWGAIISFALMLVIVPCAAIFAACGSSEVEKKQELTIVGTWTLEKNYRILNSDQVTEEMVEIKTYDDEGKVFVLEPYLANEGISAVEFSSDGILNFYIGDVLMEGFELNWYEKDGYIVIGIMSFSDSESFGFMAKVYEDHLSFAFNGSGPLLKLKGNATQEDLDAEAARIISEIESSGYDFSEYVSKNASYGHGPFYATRQN